MYDDELLELKETIKACDFDYLIECREDFLLQIKCLQTAVTLIEDEIKRRSGQEED